MRGGRPGRRRDPPAAGGLIDKEAETARHRKSLTDIEKQIGAIGGKLGNEGFVKRAPADVVEQQRAKLAELVAQKACAGSPGCDPWSHRPALPQVDAPTKPGLIIEFVPNEGRWMIGISRQDRRDGLSIGPGVGAKGETDVAVQMELTRIIISENNDQQIIFLKEDRRRPDSSRSSSASSRPPASTVGSRASPHPRPLDPRPPRQHDRTPRRRTSRHLHQRTPRSHLLRQAPRIRHEGELIEVDSRPSDAIAVAVTVDVPIFVAEEVLNEVGQ